MKRYTKSFVIILLVAVLTVCAAVIAVAESAPAYTGTVSAATNLLNAAKSQSGADEKAAALDRVAEYLKATPIDPSAEGYAALMDGVNAEYIACGELLYSKIDPSLGLALNGVAVKKLKSFLSYHPIDPNYTGAQAFIDKAEAAYNAHLAAMADAKNALEFNISASEYDLPKSVDVNFDGTSVGSFGSSAANVGANKAGVSSGKDGSNHYYEIIYNASGHTWTGVGTGTSANGIVVEFDITTFSTMPNNVLKVEHGSTVNTSNGSSIFPAYLGFIANGSIVANDWTTVIVPKAIVKGEWTHIAFVYDPTTCYIDVYVDYELVANYFSGVNNITYVMSYVRVGANAASGSFAVDNMKIYQGTGIRTEGKLENMTNDEKLLYFVAQMSNTSFSAASRLAAYDGVTAIIGDYYKDGEYLTDNASLRTAIDTYNSFDYDTIAVEVYRETFNEYKVLADKLIGAKRSTATISDRSATLSSIDAFVKANEEKLVKISEYAQYSEQVNNARINLENDKVIVEFCELANKFSFTQNLQFLSRYYSQLEEIVVNGIDIAMLDDPEYTEFKRCYEIYKSSPEILQNAICIDNSKRIIAVAEILSEYTTEEEWIANYDYINKFVTALRQVVREGNYYLDYEGVAAAMEIYTPIDDYFYLDLQKKHIAVISEELEKFAAVDSYIEKVGVCAYISLYIGENDIDNSNPEIAELLGRYYIYLEEIEVQEKDYAQVLEQNTSYFINKVQLLQTLGTYAEIKPVYDEAMIYYYAMNIGSEEAQAAIAVFDAYTEALSAIEEASARFIILAQTLEGRSGDDLYAALVECAYYASIADGSIEGVSDAMAQYKTAYDAYATAIGLANSEILAAGVAVGSVRVCAGVAPIIAVIIKLIFG